MRLVILCIIILSLAACGTPMPTPTPLPTPSPTPGCDPERTAALVAEVEAIIAEWDDTNALAGSTGRIALSPVIQKLQDIKRQTAELETLCPEAEAMQAAMVEYMTLRIDGFLLFMAQKEDAEVSAKFAEAEVALKDWAVKWATVKGYAP